MNNFIQKNLEIVLGSMVVIDGVHRSAELSSMDDFKNNIYKVILIDNDECGEYIEIETYGTSTDSGFSLFDMPDSDSFFRHSLSLSDAPRPLEMNDCNIGKMCVIGKKIDHLPYITEFGVDSRYNRLKKIYDSKLDQYSLKNSIFKIVDRKRELIRIKSLTSNLTLILPHYILYGFSPSSLYEPKLLTRD
jgi:hypothetical protein